MRGHPVFDFPPGELTELRALTPDQAIAEASARRDAVLDARQLRALGLSSSGIRRRVERRSLFRRHQGVYAVGRADLTRRGEARAALLRCGRGAVVSHRTAGWLQDLLGPSGIVHVTTTARGEAPGRAAGVHRHYTARWRPGDVVWVEGLPCTGVARTLADLAGARSATFAAAWDNADQLRLLDVPSLAEQLIAPRPGRGVLRARLEHLDETPPTESVLEERFVALCRDSGLGPPAVQQPLRVGDRQGRVDFVFTAERLAVEVDGRRWHAIQAAQDADREKDMALREAGLEVHRYGWRQVVHDAPRVARILQLALADRRLRASCRSSATTPKAREASPTTSPAPPARG